MKAETVRQIAFGHRLCHWAFNGKALKNWTFRQIVKEHIIMVDLYVHIREIFPECKSEGHFMEDELDKTLPRELRELSKKKK